MSAAWFPPTGPDDLERLREEYEGSLSWRVTRPIRAAGRLARALRPRKAPDGFPAAVADGQIDSWLEHFYGERLQEIDRACAKGTFADHHHLFRDLDEDLWGLLLTQQYEQYPHIRKLLPDMPEPALQELWNGSSGLALAAESTAFYARLRAAYQRHGQTPLSDACVLDFGCGWGRLTRYLGRDVGPERLYGCDPVEGILDICRSNRVPATFARSDFRPSRVPFDRSFDLAFAFSVFTHLSETAHQSCLAALYDAIRPGGILIATIRPPAYLSFSERLRPALEALGPDLDSALSAPRYVFAAHPSDPRHPQDARAEAMDYGETVITMAYVRERWSRWFELLDVALQLDDPHQVILTLRRQESSRSPT